MHFPRQVLNTVFGAPLLHIAWKGSIHFVSNTALSPTTVIRVSASLSLFLLLPWQAQVFYFIFLFFCSVKMEVNYGTAYVSFSPGLYFNKETQIRTNQKNGRLYQNGAKHPCSCQCPGATTCLSLAKRQSDRWHCLSSCDFSIGSFERTESLE